MVLRLHLDRWSPQSAIKSPRSISNTAHTPKCPGHGCTSVIFGDIQHPQTDLDHVQLHCWWVQSSYFGGGFIHSRNVTLCRLQRLTRTNNNDVLERTTITLLLDIKCRSLWSIIPILTIIIPYHFCGNTWWEAIQLSCWLQDQHNRMKRFTEGLTAHYSKIFGQI